MSKKLYGYNRKQTKLLLSRESAALNLVPRQETYCQSFAIYWLTLERNNLPSTFIMIRIFCKTTRWEIPLSHSTLGRQRGWKWQRLIKKFLSQQTQETCELDPSTRDTNGKATGIANLSQSSFSCTMRQDRQEYRGETGMREQRKMSGSLPRPSGNAPCRAENVASPRVSKVPSFPLDGGEKRRDTTLLLTSCVWLRVWLVIYDAQWKLQSDPCVYSADKSFLL